MLDNITLHGRYAHVKKMHTSVVNYALQRCTFILLFGALDLLGEDLEECVMSCMPLLHQLIKLVNNLPPSLSLYQFALDQCTCTLLTNVCKL